MVQIFKTDVDNHREAELILFILTQANPACRMNFDLDDCDNVLRVEGTAFSDDDIINCLCRLGYFCEHIEG